MTAPKPAAAHHTMDTKPRQDVEPWQKQRPEPNINDTIRQHIDDQ